MAVWSITNIAGVPFKNYCALCGRQCPQEVLNAMSERARNAAYEIIRRKGATYFAIALGTTRMIEAIVRDEHTVLTASTLLTGQHGIEDVCLSLPLVLGRAGVERVIEMPISDEEQRGLEHSADILKQALERIGFAPRNATT